MFAMIAGRPAGEPGGLSAMTEMLHGANVPMRLWHDDAGTIGMAGAPSGILPEDRFDQQPWHFGDWAVVGAGRLDNRSDLLGRLGITSAEGAVMADNEIVARAVARWGEDAPRHLYGDWAFAASNAADHSVIAATDHAGSVPLFYHCAGGVLYMATQLAALLAHPAVPSELDSKVVGLHVAPRKQVGATMFANVRYLPRGALLLWHGGELRERRWWEPDTSVRPAFRRERDYVEQARALFDEAVAQRLRANGDIAAAMSGGLDSPLVAATAARVLAAHGRVLDVFTAVPEPGLRVEQRTMWDAEDWPFAAAVARMHANMIHHAVPPGGMIPIDFVPSIHRSSRWSTRNTANQVWFMQIVGQARTKGARVILGGDAGNVSLTTTGAFERADWLNPTRFEYLLRTALFRLGREAIVPRTLRKFRRWQSPQPPPEKRKPGAAFLSASFCEQHLAELWRPDPARSPRAAFVDAVTDPGKSMAGADLMAMFGTEWRDPMNDRRLLETLLTYPFAIFCTGGHPRGLARSIARGRLPECVRLRQTRGSQAPDAAAWFQVHAARYRNAFETMRASSACRDLFDLAHAERTLDALCAGDFEQDHHGMHRVLDAGLFVAAWEARAW